MALVSTSLHGELALLPLPAQAPVRESLEWKTDLQVSKNGTENPLQVRVNPRQRLTYTIPEQAWARQEAFNTQYGALRREWAVPLWTEAQLLGSVSTGLSTLSCATDVHDLRDESLALLWESPEHWQLLEISTVGEGEINLLSPTSSSFERAWLMPARRAYIGGNVAKRDNGYSALADITFEVEDNLAVPASEPDQFLGEDIYLTPPLIDGDAMQTQIQSRVDIVDYELGPVERRAPWTYNRVVRPHHFVCEGPSEVRSFRAWLTRRAGRRRRYWEPTFQSDLRLSSTGVINTAILVKSDSLLSWSPARTHVAIHLADGSWETRTLSSPTQINTSTVQFTLDSPLGVDASLVRYISWLSLRRLDTDRVEMEWVGNNVLRSTINIIEVQP